MIRLRTLLLAAAAAAPVAPAVAMDTPTNLLPSAQRSAPTVLSPSERDNYRAIFAAIHSGDWAGAAARLDGMGSGPLHAAARAELYLAKGSPVVTLDQLTALLAAAPDLPQADQLAKLAQKRGALTLPEMPPAQALVWQGGQPRRARMPNADDSVSASLNALVQPLIVADQPNVAETTLNEWQEQLTPQALTEYRQRIAWSYYLNGEDADARRLGDLARIGVGEWALQAAWTSGLAAWRMQDCKAAGDAFATVGARATDPELAAAGNYWAARADMMCGHFEYVQGRLRTAARLKETFYGLLAASALGIRSADFAGLHNFRDAEWRPIAGKANVKAAIALAEIGEADLADSFIRYQARIGGQADHAALIHLACDLNLPYTQFWLAHNAPRGAQVNIAARYPSPDWSPSGGWRVDRSLVYAHALQESNFRTAVVSPAGAVGLMQVLPGTAKGIASKRGQAFAAGELSNPSSNMEYGQSYLEYLRGQDGTGGLLPKVIAAYNAGPAPIAEWNLRQRDRGDPLLYIESIPYWETRGYVPIVLRNYWIYESEAGKASSSRHALAQGMWPRFPGMPGATAVRIDPPRVAYAQDSGAGSN